MTAKYRERLADIEATLLLRKTHIDVNELRIACSYGIPDILRPLSWRLLLNYLPIERNSWQVYLKKQRENYEKLVDDIIVLQGTSNQDSADGLVEDHPLCQSPRSEWKSYFCDNEVLNQIDKDVRRLCPEIDFFQRLSRYPHRSAAKVNLSQRIRQENLPSETYKLNECATTYDFIASPTKCADKEYANMAREESDEFNWQVVERILFIYSKLNPGIKYVQGMNEIVGPIYYVFATDNDEQWAMHAETDTYYCFQLLMSEIKDNFIKTLDNSYCGIESMMYDFYERLRACDEALYLHMNNLNIKPQFYAFRWLSLLLSQEFPLPDVITIWDSLFSNPNIFNFLHNICLAMLEKERDELLEADFSTCLRLLQNYREIDVGQLIVTAHEISEGRYASKHSLGNVANAEKNAVGRIFTVQKSKLITSITNAVRNFSKK